jgi:hypothetical protein
VTEPFALAVGNRCLQAVTQRLEPPTTTSQARWATLVTSLGDVLTRRLVWLVLRYFDQFRWDFDP